MTNSKFLLNSYIMLNYARNLKIESFVPSYMDCNEQLKYIRTENQFI